MDSREALSFIEGYSQQAGNTLSSLANQKAEILSIADALQTVVEKGGRIYTLGNGGSACDAMHFAEELVARYLRERPGIRAQHLIDSGTMTCWANDYDFDTVFSRQVETLVEARDAVVGFSTSGNSTNILNAIEAGNKLGATTVGLTGKDGGRIKEIASHSIVVSSSLTSHIQEAHIAIVHMLCDIIEQRVFPDAR